MYVNQLATTRDNKYLPLPCKKEKDDSVRLIRRNNKVFAWSVNQVPIVNLELTCHRLNKDPSIKLVRYCPCRMALDKKDKLNKEAELLLLVGFNKHIKYPKLISYSMASK